MNRSDFFTVNCTHARKPRLLVYVAGAGFVELSLTRFLKLPNLAFLLGGKEYRLNGNNVHFAD